MHLRVFFLVAALPPTSQSMMCALCLDAFSSLPVQVVAHLLPLSVQVTRPLDSIGSKFSPPCRSRTNGHKAPYYYDDYYTTYNLGKALECNITTTRCYPQSSDVQFSRKPCDAIHRYKHRVDWRRVPKESITNKTRRFRRQTPCRRGAISINQTSYTLATRDATTICSPPNRNAFHLLRHR